MTIVDAPLAVSVAVATFLPAADVRTLLTRGEPSWPYTFWDSLSKAEQDEAAATGDELISNGWAAIGIGDADYPARLRSMRAPPGVIFVLGDATVLKRSAIGMCGSRRASEAGLRAARACATVAASHGLVVVSGNATGVDIEAHIGALENGGVTVLVLPEGAAHYKPRPDIAGAADRVVVVSQFAPRRPWHVSSAMARNGVIAALSDALVVIEAGSEGGTLDAGKQALRMGRPVIALEYESMPTPPGNAILHDRGAMRLGRPSELARLLKEIRERGGNAVQVGLAL